MDKIKCTESCKKLLLWAFFSALVVLFGNMEVSIPGGRGVNSNFAEVALLTAIPFFRHWLWLFSIAIFTVFNVAPEGNIVAEAGNHMFAVILMWYLYKRYGLIKNGFTFVFTWIGFLIIYYYFLLIPFIFIHHWIIGNISISEIIPSMLIVGKSVIVEVILTTLIIILFYLMVRELQFRKRSNQELANQKALLQAQNDATQEGTLVVDNEGKIVSWNHRFQKIWNIPSSILETKSDASAIQYIQGLLVHPDEFISQVKKIYAEPLKTHKDTLYLVDGRIIERFTTPILVESDVYIHSNQHLQGRIWFFNDITSIKKTEVALTKRTADLEEILRAMTHDLRSPLVNISSFSEMIKIDVESKDYDSLNKDVLYISNNVLRISQMLDSLLHLGRLVRLEKLIQIESLKTIVQKSLNYVSEDVRTLVEDQLLDIPELEIQCEPESLAMAFAQVIDNSVKFARPGVKPAIQLLYTKQGQFTKLSWIDAGMGIESQYTSKLFDLFEKINPKSPGVGIGLTIVRRVVELHEGHVDLYSAGMGKGCSIVMSFPNSIIR